MVYELELQASNCEMKITKKEYITLLKDHFTEATTKSIRVERRVCVLQVQL